MTTFNNITLIDNTLTINIDFDVEFVWYSYENSIAMAIESLISMYEFMEIEGGDDHTTMIKILKDANDWYLAMSEV